MLILPLAVALLGQPPASTTVPRTWEVDGTPRKAIVLAPARPSAGRLPLVFDFHGHGGTAEQAARRHHLHAAWPEAVVVYMQGLNTPGKLTDPEGKRPGWQAAPGAEGDRDLKFFDAVLASMKADYPIDEHRVFVTGHSNGGGFSYLLWATRGGSIAACAPVSSVAGPFFAAARPKPLFHAAGTKDPLVRFAAQERTIARVKALNGCDVPGQDWAPGARRFPSPQGTPVVVYTHDGGHEYPAAVPDLIVRFFREEVR